MPLIFGFDIGTTSIGFAAIEYDPVSSSGRILRLGSRIFPEARDPKGTPLNQSRREKRLVRRQLRRRRQRRRDLNTALQTAGLLPPFGGPEWAGVMAADPVALRVQGLEEPLTPFQLGRSLYHLAKRRHFRGRDLEEAETGDDVGTNEEAADEKAARTARDSTIKALKATGHTLGQHLSHREPGERQRGVHALRRHVEDEFERLCAAQQAHHPALADPVFKATICDLIFAQKPVFWRLNTLGACRLEPGADLAPKGSWLSAQRRMLEKLNNLEISGGNARPLDPEERAAILAKLQTQQSMSWGGARDALKPIFKSRGLSMSGLKFNLEVGGDPKLLGNVLEAKLANIFGSEWSNHPHKSSIRNAVHHRLWNADYGKIGEQRVVIKRAVERAEDRREAAKTFGRDFDATAGQVADLAKLGFPTGWDAFSTLAIERLLPELEAGRKMGQLLASPEMAAWRDATFPRREQATGEVYDKLPSPASKDEAARIRTIRNPTVVRTQNELRKVVNNLIDFCGRKPDLIRVELARDVGKGKNEREEIRNATNAQAKRREAARRDLRTNGISEPNDRDVEKYLLWKESGERDPYTGDQIGFTDLFRDGAFEVEHIWPRSLSLDDSFRNKTLCRKDVNIAKGNRIPFEHFSSRPDEWAALKDRLTKMTSTRPGQGMSPGKVKRFLAETIPDGFASRQLNDTGYAGREAVAFLKRLWPDLGPTAPVNVQTVSGKVTAHLRRLWGLNHILGDTGEKNRADHRHHAIDALVVACAHPGVSQALSRYWQLADDPRAAGTEKPRLDTPWPDIRAAAEVAANAVVVSHRVRKKVSGALHKETVYGDTGEELKRGGVTYRIIVNRTPIGDLTLDDVMADSLETAKFMIRDAAIRQCLREHLAAFQGDIKKAMANPPRLGGGGPHVRKVRLLSKRQIDGLACLQGGFADPDAKHHIAVYRSDTGAYRGEIVSLLEAATRVAKKLPVVDRRPRDGSKFIMTLSKGDTVAINDPRSVTWVVRELKSNGQITLVPSTEARPTKQATAFKPTTPGFMKLSPKKLSVDPIGRVRPAND